jgi:hypothetical protein
MAHDDATRDEERRRAEHESGGRLAPLGVDGWKRLAELEAQAAREQAAAEDYAGAINAIWDRYAAAMDWARGHRRKGDTFRAELSARQAWAQVERAFAQLAEPANTNHGRPELRLIAGEHAAFCDPAEEPTVVETAEVG